MICMCMYINFFIVLTHIHVRFSFSKTADEKQSAVLVLASQL